MARAQIIRAAGRQFTEGDVHTLVASADGQRRANEIFRRPAVAAYVTSFYINVTGDRSVLDEVVSFIEAPPLETRH